MNIKPLIVKKYLESLTEERELNVIFPILLNSLGFEVLSKPTENKGLTEYGKDIVAVGKDEDGIKKRIYFELKGGDDRDITKATFYDNENAISKSLFASNFVNYSTSYKGFDKLPKKIVLVHNGILSGKIREEYEGFIKKFFPKDGDTEYERWDIEKLTTLFADSLFGAYLLTDQNTTKLFNKVLINLNASNNISIDYIQLLETLFNKNKWNGWSKKRREWILLFETLKLISLIIYTEAKDYNNLDIAKRYLTHLVIRYWYWILKNKLEKDKRIIKYFDEALSFYLSILDEYFERTLPIAKIKNGLASEISGRYEEVGYTKRTFEYLEYLSFFLSIDIMTPKTDKKVIRTILSTVIYNNSVAVRPLVDINSITIINILNLYFSLEDKISATNYLKAVISYIINGKEKYDRIPDANNSYENVIRFTITREKPVYYSDSTSPLIAVLFEYIILLNLQEEYNILRDFTIKHKINLGIFTPHHGIASTSKHLIDNNEDDLEEQLFSNPRFNDGYQREITLFKDFDGNLSFEEFKNEFQKRINEFQYEYKTDKARYSFLRSLAHMYFKTPYFPDKWRNHNLD